MRIPDGLHIYLKDETAGKTVELLPDSKYRIYLDGGNYDRRFSLVFRKSGEVISPALEPVFRAYFTGKTLYGYFDKVTGEKCHITIANLLGQVLWSKEVVGNGQQHVIGKQYSSGIYIVSFHANDKVVSRKVFIVNQ
nr:T9SS type A sorting domain-containing protein [Chitinophaga polysaccharea]